MAASSLYSLTNPVFGAFCFHGALVVSKMVAMSLAVAYYRITRKAFANKEDDVQKGKNTVKKDNEDVERMRRAHQNDLENIPAFVLLGLLYVGTDPALTSALWLFRIFTAARFIHTVVYALQLQPWRALCHLTGLVIMFYMTYCVCSATA